MALAIIDIARKMLLNNNRTLLVYSLLFNNYLISRTESRLNFSTISVEEEVLSIINNLDNTNNSGYDDISNELIYDLINKRGMQTFNSSNKPTSFEWIFS